MATITEFLAPVVATVARDLSILDTDGDIDITNATLISKAEEVYNFFCGYTNRTFHEQTSIVEVYSRYKSMLELRVLPIDSVTEIRYLDADTVISSSDYTVYNRKINFGSTIPLYNYELGSKELKITYAGGYATADLHKRLYPLLIQQTAAWYNNRTTIGFTSYNFNGNATTKTNMKFGLLDNVKQALDDLTYTNAMAEDY